MLPASMSTFILTAETSADGIAPSFLQQFKLWQRLSSYGLNFLHNGAQSAAMVTKKLRANVVNINKNPLYLKQDFSRFFSILSSRTESTGLPTYDESKKILNQALHSDF